jgi:hypothetical protein
VDGFLSPPSYYAMFVAPWLQKTKVYARITSIPDSVPLVSEVQQQGSKQIPTDHV